MPLIAIDGPAGSGKSTVARAVASRLGWAHLDTGAMYRAVALMALRHGLDPAAGEEVAQVAREIEIELGDRVMANGQDVTEDIRSAEVNNVVSTVAANPEVRAEMVRRQRAWAGVHDGGVVEGRDIGSVVFPHADLKVFLTAEGDVRAHRRREQASTPGDDAPPVAAVAADLARRDHLDATRDASPLRVADGALLIDTTSRSVADVVDEILAGL